MSDSRTRTVIVTLPEGTRADWLSVAQILSWRGFAASVPLPVFLVLRGRVLGWISRWFTRRLLDPVRRNGGVIRAAAGPISRLDLARMAALARNEAAARWRTWYLLIAPTGPDAHPWEYYRTLHEKDPVKMSLSQAQGKFEAQPRVLAMLAYNSYPAAPHRFDPYRLAEYQAGEAVYLALHWQHAITGDALITPEGRLLEPASDSIADRLRYLGDASRVVHALKPHQHLVAARAALAPPHD